MARWRGESAAAAAIPGTLPVANPPVRPADRRATTRNEVIAKDALKLYFRKNKTHDTGVRGAMW